MSKNRRGTIDVSMFYYSLKCRTKVGSKEKHTELENNPDEEEMDDVNIDDERERHWTFFFEENEGGVDDKKALLHAKR